MVTIDIRKFDHHYACFYVWCRDNKLLPLNSSIPDGANSVLKQFGAHMLFEDNWVTHIVFNTEEDLICFKLKFN